MSEDSRFAHGPHNASMPEATVIPVLRYPDAIAAAEWLCRAFGFSERLRIGTHRVQLNVGQGAVVVTDGLAPSASPQLETHSLMIRVANVDRHFEHAKREGATILMEPESFPYGERQYSAADPSGRVWKFSQSEANVPPSAWVAQFSS